MDDQPTPRVSCISTNTGFFSWFQRQAHPVSTAAVHPIDSPSNAPSPATATPECNAEISKLKTENAKLKAENKKLKAANGRLEDKCEALTMQAKLNQDMLEQSVEARKAEKLELMKESLQFKAQWQTKHEALQQQADIIAKENIKLKTRCEELAMQSELNQTMLHECTTSLAAKDAEVQTLQAKLQHIHPAAPIPAPSIKDPEILTLESTIHRLESSLSSLQSNYDRLTAMGCVPLPLDTTPALHRRIETLELENSILQEKLDTQTSKHKSRILDYAEELNSLNDQLRATETDASGCSSQLRVLESAFRTMHGEYGACQGELERMRGMNKRGSEKARRNGEGGGVDNVLAAQLAAAQATSLEREKLLNKLKIEQKKLVATFSEQREKHAEQVKKIDELHTENAKDRKKFEKFLKARDRAIEELQRVIREKKCRCREVREETWGENEVVQIMEKLEGDIRPLEETDGLMKVDSVMGSEGKGRRRRNTDAGSRERRSLN